MTQQALQDQPRLVGDIGGTNARFAWLAAPGEAPSQLDRYACADHGSLQDAMRHYLDAHQLPAPRWCARPRSVWASRWR